MSKKSNRAPAAKTPRLARKDYEAALEPMRLELAQSGGSWRMAVGAGAAQ